MVTILPDTAPLAIYFLFIYFLPLQVLIYSIPSGDQVASCCDKSNGLVLSVGQLHRLARAVRLSHPAKPPLLESRHKTK